MTTPTPIPYLINGRADAGISPLDRGFAYGDGVFRTLKVVAGNAVNWQLHHQKLLEDCNVLGIVCPSEEILKHDIQQLFQADESGVAKIIITRGEGVRGYALPALAQPTRAVIKTAMPDYPLANFEQGVNLHLCQLRLSLQPRYAGIKHLNRLENVMARMEWTDPLVADGVLLDAEENVIECTMSNIFARFGNQLATPSLVRCGVAGITRQRILALASELGLKPEVRNLPLQETMQADELLICNSLYGVWQVRAFNHQRWAKLDTAERILQALQA